ncbi:MAG: peptidoglycan-binding protein [Clostridia bacterium]|nr:peptidoglycan-binding protein [Clostridia bacterium]
MFKLRKSLHMLTVLTMVIVLAFGAVPAGAVAAGSETEPTPTLEIVSSYPYTTKTKVKVNLRKTRSVRGELLRHIPAGAEITVNSVSQKSGWANVTYGKYTGYVRSEYIILKEVKKIVVTPTPTPIPTLSPEEDAGGYKILQNGDSGDDVMALQEALIELKYLKGTADGEFGRGTENAVKAFQQKNDYPVTGIMDANIQAFLYTGTPKNASGEKVSVKTLSPVEGVAMKKGNKGFKVRALQERLQELGYYKEKTTGTYDTNTIGAVRSFQKKNGLKADGTAGAETQKAIYSTNAVRADTTPTPKVTESPTPTPTVAVPEEPLKNGDKGADVKTLQKRLKELGYFNSTIDGKFGRDTVNALKAFQEAHGLDADGVAGKTTYDVLFSANALQKGTTPTPSPTQTPNPVLEENNSVSWPKLQKDSAGDAVAQLQEALIELGYLSGKADGTYGAKTVAAVKAFQKANGLTVDGVAGEETQKVLYSGNAKSAKEAKATATPTPTPTTKTKATPTPTPTVLKTGTKGTKVKELQNKLIQLGYLTGKADGVYGAKTAEAVKAFQKANKLTADGVAGTKTLSKLSLTGTTTSTDTQTGTTTTTTQTTASTTKPSASRVQYANWYDKIKAVARKYPYVTLYDFASGINWQGHIISLGAHADYEPVTANDTAKMVKAFGGNTWTPKAVWVVFSDGSVYLGSTHSMPHDVYHVKDNNFNGHSCIHFPRTQEQVSAIGPYATKHQETIDAAWAETQKMK